MMSSTTRSGANDLAFCSTRLPSSTHSTSKPSKTRLSLSTRASAASSSTTRMRFFIGGNGEHNTTRGDRSAIGQRPSSIGRRDTSDDRRLTFAYGRSPICRPKCYATAMRRLSWILTGRFAGWLATGVCISVGLLSWFGYHAILEWRHSSLLVAERRASEAADLLLEALTHDMHGVQQSVLTSPQWSDFAADR